MSRYFIAFFFPCWSPTTRLFYTETQKARSTQLDCSKSASDPAAVGLALTNSFGCLTARASDDDDSSESSKLGNYSSSVSEMSDNDNPSRNANLPSVEIRTWTFKNKGGCGWLRNNTFFEFLSNLIVFQYFCTSFCFATFGISCHKENTLEKSIEISVQNWKIVDRRKTIVVKPKAS
jgi:hypothetical protein